MSTMYEPKTDPWLRAISSAMAENPAGSRLARRRFDCGELNLNIEGGAEATIANGDDLYDGMLNDIGVSDTMGQRATSRRVGIELGSRRWRLAHAGIFVELQGPVEHMGVARALEPTSQSWLGRDVGTAA